MDVNTYNVFHQKFPPLTGILTLFFCFFQFQFFFLTFGLEAYLSVLLFIP